MKVAETFGCLIGTKGYAPEGVSNQGKTAPKHQEISVTNVKEALAC
jgi:hypothetical protein